MVPVPQHYAKETNKGHVQKQFRYIQWYTMKQGLSCTPNSGHPHFHQFTYGLPGLTLLWCNRRPWTWKQCAVWEWEAQNVEIDSWFQAFAVFWMSRVIFWVVLRRVAFNSRRFGTVDMKCVTHLTSTHLWRWKRHSVLKRRLLNTIRQRTTQKITHNMEIDVRKTDWIQRGPEQGSVASFWQYGTERVGSIHQWISLPTE
jgi:hypothetical protein